MTNVLFGKEMNNTLIMHTNFLIYFSHARHFFSKIICCQLKNIIFFYEKNNMIFCTITGNSNKKIIKTNLN